jgi:hypothetical protein
MYADVSGPIYKLNAQLQACDSKIVYASVFGPNYKLNPNY